MRVRKVNYKFLTVLILAVIIIAIFKMDKIKKVFSSLDVEIVPINSFEINEVNPDKSRFYNKGIAYYSNNKVTLLDYTGKKIWSKTIAYLNPLVHLGKDKIYVADSDSGQINALNINGQIIWKYEPKNAILNIGEEDGNLIILSQNLSQKSRINIVDSSGKLVSNNMLEKGTALNIEVSNKYREYACISIEMFDNKVKSYVYAFDINGKLIFSKEFDGEFVYDISFIDRENLIYVSDKTYGRISKESVVWSKEIDEDSYVEIDKNKNIICCIVEGFLKYIRYNGNVINKVEVKGTYDDIVFANKFTYLINGQDLAMIEDSKKVVNKYTHEESISNMDMINNKVVLIAQNKCTVLEYKYIEEQ
ncbi:DUF5711 family protein [Clostridiaceae bacterium M8S5]|nr:DUF5711 family protein [Clostridiaceae bacterium M8S5]